jgi:hypothetical protein
VQATEHCDKGQGTDSTLAGAKQFSNVDVMSGYWQVNLNPGHEEKSVLDRSRSIAVQRHVLWPLQYPAVFKQLMETVLKVMSCVLGRRHHDWPHVQRAPAQPVCSVPAIQRTPPEAESGEVPTVVECSTVPQTYCITTSLLPRS